MKNVILTIIALGLITASMNAALVPNGDFESPIGTAEGWDVWTGGGTVIAHEFTTGGNPDGYVDLAAPAAAGWFGWYQPTPLSFKVLGAPAGSTITLQADMKSFDSNLDAAGIKLEASGGTAASAETTDPITTDWATYSVDLVTNPENTGLTFSLMCLAGASGAPSTDGYDNCQLIVGRKALFPVPAVDALIPANTTELTWKNPDPSLSGPVTAEAYLLESDDPLDDPNLGPIDFNNGALVVQTLAVTGQSADITGLLTPAKHYYWAVHTIDPNDGGTPVTTKGFTWHFEATADAVPIVDAGTDKYLVSTGSPMTINLGASVSDDELAGQVTITWTDLTNPADKDPDTTVSFGTIAANGDVDVTLTNEDSGVVTGYYIFEISVEDGIWPAVTDQVIVNVLGTCGEAADADPNDDYDITGDLNLDCKKDLADFAIFAAAWLDCNTNRPGDVTCP